MLISNFCCPHCGSIEEDAIIKKPDEQIECRWCKTKMNRFYGNAKMLARKERMLPMDEDWRKGGKNTVPYPKGRERGKRFLTKLRSKKLGL